MNLSPLVQAVIVYMKDHFPINAKELNFHAELKAASQWCWSDDYKQLVVKKVPDGDCRLKIAAKETLKTWEKMEKELQSTSANKINESVDKKLSGGPRNYVYRAVSVSIGNLRFDDGNVNVNDNATNQ